MNPGSIPIKMLNNTVLLLCDQAVLTCGDTFLTKPFHKWNTRRDQMHVPTGSMVMMMMTRSFLRRIWKHRSNVKSKVRKSERSDDQKILLWCIYHFCETTVVWCMGRLFLQSGYSLIDENFLGVHIIRVASRDPKLILEKASWKGQDWTENTRTGILQAFTQDTVHFSCWLTLR